MKKIMLFLLAGLLTMNVARAQGDPEKLPAVFETLIFPMQPQHAHSSCMVALPNGDLLAVWYQGSGEKEADDVKILGARLRKGAGKWSDPFLMADCPGIADCNPVVFMNSRQQLFLVWIAVRDHKWERSLLCYKTSADYLQEGGAPRWSREGSILLAPGEGFTREFARKFPAGPYHKNAALSFGPRYGDSVIAASRDTAKTNTGWMTRIKPLILKSGRILLPLYSDGFSMSLIAISDDDGASWKPSLPIVGRGNVQPALAVERNGKIIAYMRDNGEIPNRVQVSESADNGYSWTAAVKTGIPNTASVELLKLKDGRWVFVGDDEDDGRYRLSIYVSRDEGRTWGWKRTLENVARDSGSFSYPCILQTNDGLLHISYSYSMGGKGECIKYVVADPKLFR